MLYGYLFVSACMHAHRLLGIIHFAHANTSSNFVRNLTVEHGTECCVPRQCPGYRKNWGTSGEECPTPGLANPAPAGPIIWQTRIFTFTLYELS